LQEAAQALLSAQQVGCAWPNITDKVSEYLGRAESLKQLTGAVAGLCSRSVIVITTIIMIITESNCSNNDNNNNNKTKIVIIITTATI